MTGPFDGFEDQFAETPALTDGKGDFIHFYETHPDPQVLRQKILAKLINPPNEYALYWRLRPELDAGLWRARGSFLRVGGTS